MPHECVLRDHALGYLLAGIAGVPELAQGRARRPETCAKRRREAYVEFERMDEDVERPVREWR